jgi:hypothetical protein
MECRFWPRHWRYYSRTHCKAWLDTGAIRLDNYRDREIYAVSISVFSVSHDRMISEQRNENLVEGDSAKPNSGLYWQLVGETEEEIHSQWTISEHVFRPGNIQMWRRYVPKFITIFSKRSQQIMSQVQAMFTICSKKFYSFTYLLGNKVSGSEL